MEPIYYKIYKSLLYYELDGLRINEDGTTTYLHSDKFMNEHPERTTNKYTEDEYNQMLDNIIKYMYGIITYQKQ